MGILKGPLKPPQIAGLVIFLSLLIALPLTIFQLMTGKFETRKRAATGDIYPCYQAGVSDNFDDGAINYGLWQPNLIIPGLGVGGSFFEAEGKFHLIPFLGPGDEKGNASGSANIATRFQVIGDFRVEAEATLELGSPHTGQAGIFLSNLQGQGSLGFYWQKSPLGSSLILNTDYPGRSSSGGPVGVVYLMEDNPAVIRLRLVRQGNRAFAEADTGSGFRQIAFLGDVYSGIGSIMLVAREYVSPETPVSASPIPVGPIRATFDNFQLGCPGPYPSPVTPPPSPVVSPLPFSKGCWEYCGGETECQAGLACSPYWYWGVEIPPCPPGETCLAPPPRCVNPDCPGRTDCVCPTLTHPVKWETETVQLEADDFFLTIGGRVFRAIPDKHTLVSVHSDPGNLGYTTLEVSWQEQGVEMRLYLYFHSDGERWWVNEIRTYNGNIPGDWLYYRAGYLSSNLGSALFNAAVSITSEDGLGTIHFRNLYLKPFKNLFISPPPFSKGCWEFCNSGTECKANLVCSSNWVEVPPCPPGQPCPVPQPRCVNPGCPGRADCVCPTPTPVSQTLLFKIKFAGVNSRPANDNPQTVRLFATSTDGGWPAGSAEGKISLAVTPDDNGVYHGSLVLTGQFFGYHYRLRIKGPKHLQEVFADVVFKEGEEADLTGSPLRPGDLNNDGMVSFADIAEVDKRIFSESSADLAVADVDLNNKVNIIDRTLILNTLSVQYDRE